MDLKKDFREFVESLNEAGVRYLVVGAYAVAFHGLPRYTKDMDFLVDPTPENGSKVLNALRRFGFADLKLSLEDVCRPDKVVQLGVPPVRIDILTTIDGITFDDAFRRCVRARIAGLELHFIGKQDLIHNKRTTGRPQDLADVARLEALDDHGSQP